MSEDASSAMPALVSLAGERDSLLGRIHRRLEGDARVGAAWLSGSFGRGEADAWSDLDLHVAVTDEYLAAFLAERPSLYAAVGHPILVQQEMLSDSQSGAHFQLVLYTGPLEVDWNIGPLSRAERPSASALLFDRAGTPLMALPALTPDQRRQRAEERLIFFWAMAPIAIKYAGRGETRRVGRQIELMTNAYIALWRLLREPVGPEPYLPRANRPLEPELDASLPMLGEQIDPRGALLVIRGLCGEVERLHPALAALRVTAPLEVPEEVARLAVIAEAAIRSGNLPRRKFR